jgi:hypothetical protein
MGELSSDRLSAVERLCHLIQIKVLERDKQVNCLGATSANALAPGSRSLRPLTIDPERLPPQTRGPVAFSAAAFPGALPTGILLPVGLTVSSSATCSAARGLPAVDLKKCAGARRSTRAHSSCTGGLRLAGRPGHA